MQHASRASQPERAQATATWQQALRLAYTDVPALLKALAINPQQIDVDLDATFPLRVPQSFVERMQSGNPADPLLRQVLPIAEEHAISPGDQLDPLSESEFNPTSGILHKYEGRVLLMPTGACAVHCRYCFRRHFPYADNRLDSPQMHHAMHYLANDASIEEVILSGGDPLLLGDASLARLFAKLSGIPHIKRIRIHTRTPVVLPQRITEGLCEALAQTRLQTIVVLHINHPAEIDQDLATRLALLKSATDALLNQSVLLAGVNDNVQALVALSQRLFEVGVLPYYLHMLDPVQGAAHFRVDDEYAAALHADMRAQLPGYLVPRLVREIPGEKSKTVLA